MATPPPHGKLRSLAQEDADYAAERRANTDATRIDTDTSRSFSVPTRIPGYQTITTPSSNPTRAVVYALLLAAIILFMGGSTGIRKLRNGINATTGRPALPATDATGAILSVEVFTGWAALFIIFVALTDNDTTAPVGVAFAYLLLLSIFLTVGPVALTNIASLGRPVTTGGGGSGKKRI